MNLAFRTGTPLAVVIWSLQSIPGCGLSSRVNSANVKPEPRQSGRLFSLDEGFCRPILPRGGSIETGSPWPAALKPSGFVGSRPAFYVSRPNWPQTLPRPRANSRSRNWIRGFLGIRGGTPGFEQCAARGSEKGLYACAQRHDVYAGTSACSQDTGT